MSNAMYTLSDMLEEGVKKIALKYFDGVGFAKAGTPASIDVYSAWLDEGFHGQMEYLRRHLDRKRDPQLLLPNAKSWIALSLNYDTTEPLSIELQETMKQNHTGWVARYARDGDYHEKISVLHEKMISELTAALPGEQFLSCVDTKAVLEREVAQKAGLGWLGKNTCLINQNKGSFLFLSEILTTIELSADKPVADHCGTCTKCLDACPTQALIAPRQLDATRCISYWTIENNKTQPPTELAARFGVNFFGCDICQDVCPWNARARRKNRLAPAIGSGMTDVQEITRLSEAEIKNRTKNSAMNRAKPEHLKRNAQIVLENLKR